MTTTTTTTKTYPVAGSFRRKLVKPTGEKRCPRKGEWFLSGAIIEGYLAVNDLSTVYHIAKLV